MDNNYYLVGWKTIEDAASEIWQSIHRDLLSGEPLFLFRGFDNLQQTAVVRREDNSYMVGIITKTYTMFVPKAPLDYVIEMVPAILVENKIDKKIIENFNKLVSVINSNGK